MQEQSSQPAHILSPSPVSEEKQMSRTQLYMVVAVLSLAVIGLVGYIMWDHFKADDTTTQPTITETEETEEETPEVIEIGREGEDIKTEEQETDSLLNSGTISGSLSFPAGIRPAMKVCAVNTVTDETICTEEYEANPCDEGGCPEGVIQPSNKYSLELAPGTYAVYSEVTDSDSESYKVRGYYSYYSYCISSEETKMDPSPCLEEHTPTDGIHYDIVELTLEAGETIENITPTF